MIVLIQPYPSPDHLLLSFSPSPRSLSPARRRMALASSSVIRPTLLKHDFRRQTKRASVVYNEAPLVRFLAVVPGVVTFLLPVLFASSPFSSSSTKNMAKFKAAAPLLFLLFIRNGGSIVDPWIVLRFKVCVRYVVASFFNHSLDLHD